jgi:hypothetical protein
VKQSRFYVPSRFKSPGRKIRWLRAETRLPIPQELVTIASDVNSQVQENDSLSDLMSNEVPKGSIRHFAPLLSLGTYIVMPPPHYEESERRYLLCVILHGNGSNELVHSKIADKLGRNGVIYAVVRAPYSSVGVIASTGQPAYSAIPDEVDNSENDPIRTTLRTNYVEWIIAVASDVQQNYRIEGGRFSSWG